MTLKDSFYTPTVLADKLVDYIIEQNIFSVADFCVGEGNLLKAAQSRWKNIQCFGTDISRSTIESVKKKHPLWCVKKCDFLNDSESKLIINDLKFDLILLNPPFTCKGSTINSVTLDGIRYKVSTAMTFLVKSLSYLKKEGTLYAILPISCAYAQKDRKLWNSLVKDYRLNILEEPDKQYFLGCSPNIILISINSKRKEEYRNRYLSINKQLNGFSNLDFFRGKFSMYQLPNVVDSDTFLIHSTNLKKNRVEGLNRKISYPQSELNGPAVLMQRVGNPNIEKICIITSQEKYVLSDCIIAIKTGSDDECLRLKNILIDNWDKLETYYKGTGAKYITVDRLKLFLGVNGEGA